MRAPFFVETLSRNREVRQRQQLHPLPIRIGRGYDNDIILDDPHVSEHHAIVELNAAGELTLRDLGSKNAIACQGQRRTEITLDGNTIFQAGHTSLRIRTADFQVAEAMAISTRHTWEGWMPALTGLTLSAALASMATFLADADRFEATSYLALVVCVVVIGVIWSGIWAFASRLFGATARFGRHLFIFGCGVAAMELWSLLSNAVAYAFSIEILTRYQSHTLIAILAAMIFLHLQHTKPYRTRSFALTCLSLSLLGSGIMLLLNYGSDHRLADELFMHTRFPPALRLSADQPVASFLDDAAGLKTKVDRARSESADEEEPDRKEE